MIVSFLTLLMSLGFAAKADSNCQSIKTGKEFYQCSLQKHPDLEVSKLKTTEGEALVAQASQWQNPSLEARSIRGSRVGQNVSSTEVSLAVPLSQLWTRGSRQDIGNAQRQIAQIEASEILINVKKSLIQDLYRLRQIEDELQIFNESLRAFETISKQFRGRRVRGPEQEVTLNLVELATSDYGLKINRLLTEKSQILSKFKALWGAELKISKEILPRVKESWPEISTQIDVSQSFQVRKIQAEATRAQAEKSLVNRESWPAVSAGPSIERTADGGDEVTSYGFNISMDLPLLSFNQGSRNLAATRAQQATLLSDYAVRRAKLDKEILLQKYRSAIEALRRSSNWEEIRQKHKKIDGLFKQGLVGGGTVIEAHRQIAEFTESQHQHELSAIESFLELKTLSGENVEDIL